MRVDLFQQLMPPSLLHPGQAHREVSGHVVGPADRAAVDRGGLSGVTAVAVAAAARRGHGGLGGVTAVVVAAAARRGHGVLARRSMRASGGRECQAVGAGGLDRIGRAGEGHRSRVQAVRLDTGAGAAPVTCAVRCAVFAWPALAGQAGTSLAKEGRDILQLHRRGLVCQLGHQMEHPARRPVGAPHARVEDLLQVGREADHLVDDALLHEPAVDRPEVPADAEDLVDHLPPAADGLVEPVPGVEELRPALPRALVGRGPRAAGRERRGAEELDRRHPETVDIQPRLVLPAEVLLRREVVRAVAVHHPGAGGPVAAVAADVRHPPGALLRDPAP
eukprot:CAMPEP_0179297296 /NCGR_PEP_ID=MMETSP0797-20121207/45391_1 /TAXON_ID=47934 /ORGANISM="Dinophysis acuminata, Strain DAEP01" /LENGTH=333 /DNA_ID=CAMNT_0021006621 /DNA_START=338 /DNA_END=1337 /DNA_ORIENTATION=-